MLALSTALPATALGEDGSFDFPAETQTLQMVPSSITRIPIGALIEDGLQDQVDLGSAQLALPQGADESTLEQMRLGEDSHSLEVRGRGPGRCSVTSWSSPRSSASRGRARRSS